MKLTCPKCKHQWSDEPAANQAALMCPECFEFSPVARLGGAPAPAAPPKAPVAPSAPAPPAGGNLDESTVLLTPEETRPSSIPPRSPVRPAAPLAPPPRASAPPPPSPSRPEPSAGIAPPPRVVSAPPPPGALRSEPPAAPRPLAAPPPPVAPPVSPAASPGSPATPETLGDSGFRHFLSSLDTSVNAPASSESVVSSSDYDPLGPSIRSRPATEVSDPLAPTGGGAVVRPLAPRPPAAAEPEPTLHRRETLIPPPPGRASAPSKRSLSGSEIVVEETLDIPPSQPSVAPPSPKPASVSPAVAPSAARGSAPAPSGPPPASGQSPSQSNEKRPPKYPELEALVGKVIGGYRVERVLGAGGMGAVFLGHQLSLDRKVAIKILPGRFSSNPELLARFTREALSAAQLSHHNIVHVYDVGNDGETYYIGMEYIKGDNLGDMVRRDGRLRVDDAASYVLQAARGLLHAHQRGIIHRDIKPDNLMVNENGIVKVADLGLAKMLGTDDMTHAFDSDDQRLLQQEGVNDLTQAKSAMGTPAYMSPEQARDAASVDARADQYSLGCTLYYLCAGRAPYSGTTVFELISKHMKEPLTPLDVHIHGVPPAFARIVQRMLEKDPGDRYPDLGSAIKDIEDYLGVSTDTGPYKPRESHLAILESQQKNYYAAPALKRRTLALTAFLALFPACLFAAIVTRNFALAGAVFGFWFLTPILNFLYDGIRNKTYLFRRVRSAILGMPIRHWLGAAAALVAGVGVLYLLGWLPYWIGCGVLALAAAAGYQIGVVRPLTAQRADALWKMGEMLKELRLRGVPEEALQEFIARFSGERWEEFFENLFGYEDMIAARASVAAMEKVKKRKRFATWRDPIARWLDGLEEARKLAREKKQLARVEVKRFKAQGMSEAEAVEKGEEEATRILKEVVVKPASEKVLKKSKARMARRSRSALYMRLFALSRLVLGLAIVAVAGAGMVRTGQLGIPIPDSITNLLAPFWKGHEGGQLYGVAAGLALFLSAFSCRVFLPALVFLGAILITLTNPIVTMVAQPQLTFDTARFVAAALIAVGFGFPLLQKFTGGRF